MKTLLTETRIRRAPLQQLLFHREFNRRLHRLGMSARERRESAFDVKLDPSSVRHFLLSPVINGGTTHVMPSRDLSDLFDHSVDGSAQKIMHIHNHPVYNHPKYGSWNDFFSDVDLQSPFTEGSVAGLVFVPHRKDSLILLLGQQKTFSATSLAAGRNLYGEVRMNFWHKYKKGLKDFHNELGFASGALQFLREALDISERAWMRAAVESLTELGMTAVAQIYYFPQDCTEEFFLGLNSRGKLKDNWRYGGFDGFETNRKRLLAWSRKFEQQIDLGDIGDPPPLRVGKGPEPPYIHNIILRDKTSLPSHRWCFELTRQIVERGLINATLFEFPFPGYWTTSEEAEKLSKMEFLTLWDVCIKLDIDMNSLREMMASGKLIPDFTLQIEGDDRVEYVFLKVPEIHGIK